MILLIDNYDSFTYNLYQFLGEITKDIQVVRNDALTLDEIEAMAPGAIVISPGPVRPGDAGISVGLIRRFSGQIPILGICLGHQAIGEAFGGKTVAAKRLVHGKTSDIPLNDAPIFRGLPATLRVARYHSLSIDPDTLPEALAVLSTDENGDIMAVAHKEHPVIGLQFHPESIMTQYGKRILRNFVCGIAGLSSDTTMAQTPLSNDEKRILKPYIQTVIDGRDLSEEEARDAMNCIMEGDATDSQIASFVTALRMKGETISEITGFARSMRQKAASVKTTCNAIDIVGTGGDMVGTFNISTTASFVAAAAGANVAKHGNRSVSSRSGAADVLEELGVKIGITPGQAAECLDKLGICFMFAPAFHQSMRFAAAPRREIGVRSVFNILGPLSNPASAQYMMMGVYDESILEVLARVLMNLGVESGMVVHGEDGLDEVSLSGKTRVCEISGGKLIKYDISPEEFGIAPQPLSAVIGGTAKENAQITLDILNGEKGPQRDIVLLNSAAALYSSRCVESLAQGLEHCAQAIDSGAALRKLEDLRRLTNQF